MVNILYLIHLAQVLSAGKFLPIDISFNEFAYWIQKNGKLRSTVPIDLAPHVTCHCMLYCDFPHFIRHPNAQNLIQMNSSIKKVISSYCFINKNIMYLSKAKC